MTFYRETNNTYLNPIGIFSEAAISTVPTVPVGRGPVVAMAEDRQFRGGMWEGWYYREGESAHPGNGPAANGRVSIAKPGEEYLNIYPAKTNLTPYDHLLIQGNLNISESYSGAACYMIPSKLYVGSTVTLRVAFGKYFYVANTCAALRFEVYFQKVGAVPGPATKVYQQSQIPPPGTSVAYSANIDLSAYVTEDGLYQIWLVAYLERNANGAAVDYYYHLWLWPAELNIFSPPQPADDIEIKVGEIDDDWPDLEAVTLQRANPDSMTVDYRSATEFRWTAYGGEHLNLKDWNNKRVQFDYGGETRFLGRIQTIEGHGGSPQRYSFSCYDFRGCARKVDVQADPSAAPSYPSRIYNAPTTDEDYGRCVAVDQNVGEIIQDLFDTHSSLLLAADGVYDTGAMYVSAELLELDFIPGKIDLREVNFEEAVVQVLSKQGGVWNLCVGPVDGVWHFINRQDDGATTTFDIEDDDDGIVAPSLRTSTEDCFTGCTMFGRAGSGGFLMKAKVGAAGSIDCSGTDLSGLGEAWDSGYEAAWDLEKSLGERDYGSAVTHSEGGGVGWVDDTAKDYEPDYWNDGFIVFPRLGQTEYAITDSTETKITYAYTGDAPAVLAAEPFLLKRDTEYTKVYRRFYITDTAKRDLVEEGQFGGEDCCPRLFVYGFVEGTASGCIAKVSIPVRIIRGDPVYGTVIEAQSPLYSRTGLVYAIADNIGFEYCYRHATLETPFKTRFPTSGYAGTAYTVEGIERDKILIVPEFYNPQDAANFAVLAEEILKPFMDVLVQGAVGKRGLYWDAAGLGMKITLAQGVVDKIVAVPVVSVTYDFDTLETSIEISNDFREDGWNYNRVLDNFYRNRFLDREENDTGVNRDYINCAKGLVSSGDLSRQEIEGDGSDVPNPAGDVWGNFSKVAGVEPTITRCDQQTYDHEGTLHDTKPCGDGLHYLLACKDNRGGHSYADPFDGADVEAMHGIVLRTGENMSDGGNLANTHLFYPFNCVDGPYAHPSRWYGGCASGTKDLVLVVPSSVGGDQQNMETFFPALLQAYINFIVFTSQGMSCVDDRLFILDQHLWGDPSLTHQGCKAGGEDAQSFAEAVCGMFKTWSQYATTYMAALHSTFFSCAKHKVYPTSQAGDPPHTHTVATESVVPGNPPEKPDCEFTLGCCPVCTAGGDISDCCKGGS